MAYLPVLSNRNLKKWIAFHMHATYFCYFSNYISMNSKNVCSTKPFINDYPELWCQSQQTDKYMSISGFKMQSVTTKSSAILSWKCCDLNVAWKKFPRIHGCLENENGVLRMVQLWYLPAGVNRAMLKHHGTDHCKKNSTVLFVTVLNFFGTDWW